jgi:inosine/xanthosine triphosphatase
MRIAVGSTNPVKFNAVKQVLSVVYADAIFEAIGSESGVRAQPWGDEETRRGAWNRARVALQVAQSDLGIGLEGGVQETEFGLMTCAWCVIVGQDGLIGVGGSACTLLPEPIAEAVRRGLELGVAMDRLTGQQDSKYGLGAIGLLTNGLSSRQEAYVALIKMAMSPFVRGEWFRV